MVLAASTDITSLIGRMLSFTKPKLWQAKLWSGILDIHLIECQNMTTNIFPLVRPTKFLVTCHSFGHKY